MSATYRDLVPWPSLETDRLVLRPLLPDDFDALAELHAEASFWWFPFKRGRSADETRSFLDRTLKSYEDGGIAVSAVVVRDSRRLAGWAGLSIPLADPSFRVAFWGGCVRGHVARSPTAPIRAMAAMVRLLTDRYCCSFSCLGSTWTWVITASSSALEMYEAFNLIS